MIKTNPKDELKSLQEYPLPTDAMNFSVCESGMVLQTIAYLDAAIVSIIEQCAYYQKQRNLLLNRAMVEKIKQTGQYALLITPGELRRNKIGNIKIFSKRFPEGYIAIRNCQQQDIQDKYHHDMNALQFSEIPLTLADEKIGEDMVTEFVGYQPQKLTVEVRRLPGMLK
jgi:hypothetical protein